MEESKKKLVEIWGDVVAIRSLVFAILFSSFSTMGAFFLAPVEDRSKQLFFGLAGALIGFVLSSIFIKPKRVIMKPSLQDEKNEEKPKQEVTN